MFSYQGRSEAELNEEHGNHAPLKRLTQQFY